MNVRVRQASPGDLPTIADFNSRMALETEGRPLDRSLVEAGVKAVIDDARKGCYWVAEFDNRVAGQLLLTYEWSDWRNGQFWWIQSVFVDVEFRRKGVFSALYRHVESLARRDAGVCGLRLYVEKDNERAQDTYRKLGMISPGYRVMEVDFRKGPT